MSLSPDQRTTRLKMLMIERNLEPFDVGVLLHVSVHTVNAWRSNKRAPIPVPMLEFLEMKLARRGDVENG